jgi:SAM-dependent methyltransferase
MRPPLLSGRAPGTATTAARQALMDRFGSRIVPRPDLRWLASFAGNRGEPVHRWFPYKEGFSRGLVEHLLDRFRLQAGATVLDPFCGVGTTPLVARLRGLQGLGLDLLPLAVFVARVKLRTRHDLSLRRLRSAVEELALATGAQPRSRFADIPLVRKAFDPGTARSILQLRDHIQAVADGRVRDFLTLALLATLEDLSQTRKDGLCVRMHRRDHLPGVRDAVRERARAMLADLEALRVPRKALGRGRVRRADARALPLADSSVDAVITSPPYLNRYDYARIYSLELALEFLESFEELRDLRHRLLRGHIEARPARSRLACRGTVQEVLAALEGRRLNNANIPRMIHAYFEDMHRVVGELARTCRTGARVGLLVGNVCFGGEVIPVDLVLGEMAEEAGFQVESIEVTRNKGNASQQMGRYGRLPVRESVSVWVRSRQGAATASKERGKK